MRRIAGVCVAVLPFLSLLACGGRFDGNVPGDGGSSSSSGGGSGSGSGGSSGGSGGSSGGSGSSSGGEMCPAPANVQSSGACSPDGLTCPTDVTIPDCNGNPGPPLTCICQSGQWFCDAPGPGQCPVTCPDAQNVVPNTPCKLPASLTCPSATPFYDCNGNVAGDLTCTCNGGAWYCLPPPMVCPVDAGTGCPDPKSIQSGAPCVDPNTTCPGNPTQCNGQTDYDAFQCENGVWVDVAVTVCDVDGG